MPASVPIVRSMLPNTENAANGNIMSGTISGGDAIEYRARQTVTLIANTLWPNPDMPYVVDGIVQVNGDASPD
jgi:hypothetical protein